MINVASTLDWLLIVRERKVTFNEFYQIETLKAFNLEWNFVDGVEMYSTAFQYLSICIGNPIGYQGSCLNLTMVLEATVLGVGLPDLNFCGVGIIA